jgi:hypothetical protein
MLTGQALRLASWMIMLLLVAMVVMTVVTEGMQVK